MTCHIDIAVFHPLYEQIFLICQVLHEVINAATYPGDN